LKEYKKNQIHDIKEEDIRKGSLKIPRRSSINYEMNEGGIFKYRAIFNKDEVDS